MQKLDARDYGLTAATDLYKSGKKIIIEKNRKSRIIMSDGRKLVDMVEKIHSVEPKAKIVFKTNAPICSKTRPFLEEHGIQVLDE